MNLKLCNILCMFYLLAKELFNVLGLRVSDHVFERCQAIH
jgi:hypothetical protein